MKYSYICLLFILAISVTSCYDRDILESKEGESIDPISNLTYGANEPEIVFNWDLPTNFPDDILHPVSVFLTVFQDDIKISTVTIPDGPNTYTYTEYDPGSGFRFIFKVQADVDTDDPNLSSLRYSAGSVVEI
ncbi:MAG: DUF4945 domain-containing protein [Bacteroidales bacterium]|nr:DUF4945 domain-containing protein [Bacteroidales bacterium]